MKRALSVLLCSGILFSLLSGCHVSSSEADLPALEAQALMARTASYSPFPSKEGASTETVLFSDDPETAALYANAYGFTEEQWEDFATYRGTGMYAYEITVFRMKDEDTAVAGEAVLTDYITNREGDFFGYAPAQAELVSNGRVVREDRYLAVLICDDVDATADGFSKWVKAGLEGVDMSAPKAPESVENAAQLLDHLLACSALDLSQIDDLERLDSESKEALETYLLENYGLSPEQWTNAALAYSPTAPFALAVIRPASLTTLQTMRFFSGMDAWLNEREDTAPEDADPRFASAFCCAVGNYALLLSCDDPESLADFARQALKVDSIKKSDRHPEVTLPDDGLALHDLLFRMLVEHACPDWDSLEEKGWTSTRDAASWGYTALYDEIYQAYGVTQSMYQEAVIAMWSASSSAFTMNPYYATEQIAIFRCTTEEKAEQILEKLQEALPAIEARCADTGAVVRAARSERYVLLVVSPTAEDAVVAFPTVITSDSTRGFFMDFVNNDNNNTRPKGDPDPNFPDRVKYTPPGDEDMTVYDTAAILAAWEKRDPSSLSDYDRAIYDAADTLLAQLLTEGMTDLEKETAIYTWMTDNIIYDWKHVSLVGEAAREAYTPYGPLVNGSAVCLGYASGFQLLCDMSGLESVLVVGAGSNSTASHAWNVVKLDGKWACVDVTWDANGREQLGKNYQYRYFNISSDEMAKSHQWDYLNVPEAE